jgi:hypothetical protein
MNFVCCNCGELIHGPSMVVNNKFLHLNCVPEFIEEENNKDIELEEA